MPGRTKTAIITQATGWNDPCLAELRLRKGYIVHRLKWRLPLCSTSRIDHPTFLARAPLDTPDARPAAMPSTRPRLLDAKVPGGFMHKIESAGICAKIASKWEGNLNDQSQLLHMFRPGIFNQRFGLI
jgi:hypothetical protein